MYRVDKGIHEVNSKELVGKTIDSVKELDDYIKFEFTDGSMVEVSSDALGHHGFDVEQRLDIHYDSSNLDEEAIVE